MPDVTRLRTRFTTQVDAIRTWESGAISQCARMLEGMQGVKSKLLLSRCLFRLGELDGAISLLDETLREPLSAEHTAQALTLLCVATRLNQRVDEANTIEVKAIAAARAINNHSLLFEMTFGRALSVLRQNRYDGVGILMDDVLKPSALALTEEPLIDYPFSLGYVRARFSELAGFVYQSTGRFHDQLAAFQRAITMFDDSRVKDDFALSGMLANYIECATSLGVSDVVDSVIERASRFSPNPNLDDALLRIHGAAADAAALDGNVLKALRIVREGSNATTSGHRSLRMIVDRARFLHDSGEHHAAHEQLEAATSYSKMIDWTNATHEDVNQLYPLAGQMAVYDVAEADDLIRKRDALPELPYTPRLRLADSRSKGEEAYARGSIARAHGEMQTTVDFFATSYAWCLAIGHRSRAVQIAFEIAELTGDDSFSTVVQEWVDRHPASPLASKIAQYNLAMLPYREACNHFDFNRNDQCLDQLLSLFDPPSTLLRLRTLLRLHRFDDVRQALSTFSSTRATECLEAEIINVALTLTQGVSDDLRKTLETLSDQCLSSGYTNMYGEIKFLAASAAFQTGDLDRARREIRSVITLENNASSKPSAYRYDIQFWQARCMELLARCARATNLHREAERLYLHAFQILDTSRVSSNRLQAMMLLDHTASLAITGITEKQSIDVQERIEKILWGNQLRAAQGEVHLNLSDAYFLMGTSPLMMHHLRLGCELSQDPTCRPRMSVARVRLHRELQQYDEAETELALTLQMLQALYTSHSCTSMDTLLTIVEECVASDRFKQAREILKIRDMLINDNAIVVQSPLSVYRRIVAEAVVSAKEGDMQRAHDAFYEAMNKACAIKQNLGVFFLDGCMALAGFNGDDSYLDRARQRTAVNPLSLSARRLETMKHGDTSSNGPEFGAFQRMIQGELDGGK